MSRSIKLTWQAGRDGRAGRWRKKYRGSIYYFDGGRGKSDRVAYDAAIKKWELEKLKLDAAAPRLHQEQYELEIGIWEKVLAWSNRHGDSDMAQIAFEKCAKIRSMLEAPLLKPVPREDQFKASLEPPKISLPEDLFEQTARSLAAGEFKLSTPVAPSTREDRERLSKELDGSSFRIQKEVWNDRLTSMERRAVIGSNLIGDNVLAYIQQKEHEASSGELSVGRIYTIRLHLFHFRDWIGSDLSITEIDGPKLKDYYTKLLGMVQRSSKSTKPKDTKDKKRVWTAKTALEYLTTAKSFVRWLWEMELIPALPRVLGNKSKSLKITPGTSTAVVFTNDEIKSLLNESTGRTKLFVLLMLNCGMTQKDVADLRKLEVDLDAGRIIRKRSKTDRFDSVPTVNYLLWPETVRLLKEFIDIGVGELALLNSNGDPLWVEQIDENGKYSKSDNIKNAFARLTRKLEISKPLKSLKKTSSSKLRDSERFNGLEDLYLGHAPQKMSDKHYTTAPQKLFDTAICWLAEQYELTLPSVV